MQLNEVIDQMIQRIRTEVLMPNMNAIPLAYLMTRNIPQAVKHYFDQEVENWIREEQDKIFASERFDYERPEVRLLLDQIFDILKNTASFSLIKFNQLLERAIKLEANYLIRPHTTLRQFLFKDSPIISTIQVYDTLKYFTHLNYYKDALTQYFNKKYMKEISEPQFAELIRQIDEQVFSKNPVQAVLKITKSILNFLNEGRTPSTALPIQVLIEAYEDRNLTTYAKLMKALQNKGLEEITFEQLQTLLTTGQLPQITPRPAVIKEVQPSAAESLKEKLQKKISLEEVKDIEESKPVIQVEKISISEQAAIPVGEPEEEPELEEEEEEEEEQIPASSPAAGGGKAEEELAMIMAKKLQGDLEKLERLENLISKKDEKVFIKKLFKKNTKKYYQLIKNINDTSEWKQASMMIDQTFYELGINPYSKEALAFTDLVYSRFFPKEKELRK